MLSFQRPEMEPILVLKLWNWSYTTYSYSCLIKVFYKENHFNDLSKSYFTWIHFFLFHLHPHKFSGGQFEIDSILLQVGPLASGDSAWKNSPRGFHDSNFSSVRIKVQGEGNKPYKIVLKLWYGSCWKLVYIEDAKWTSKWAF